MPKQVPMNPIQPVAVVTPIEMIPAQLPPTWIETHVLFPLENVAWNFLYGTLILLASATFLDFIGLLP